MKKMRTIVDLMTTKLRISLTWRKSKLTQRKRSRRKKRRREREKIRNRRLSVLKRSRRSKRLRLQIASASEMWPLMRRKMKMMSLRDHLRITVMRIVWECRLFFSFVFVYLFLFKLNFLLCSDSTWSRVCALNDDNQRDICMKRSISLKRLNRIRFWFFFYSTPL